VAIKVLAPGYYASQDIRTPVKIVLVVTQLLNVVLVPRMAHAGLALSIGLGALVNALWLLVGLLRRGRMCLRRGGCCMRCRCWRPVA
jgi:putative peptidoglycan lipid II flippase